jgi:hypothetical protein
LLLAALFVLSGCHSGGGGGGTGLVSGTVDNDLARDMFKGMSESDARSGLNGAALSTGPDGCESYRGVDQSLSSGFTATGVMWTICFSGGKLRSISHVCPSPWMPGEVSRYKQAGYGGRPTAC